jgi:sugar transferase (PEP-CTERM/EpsH1 system associated)
VHIGLRILYVAYRAPYPPDKGERIRMYHQIRELSRIAEVHLIYPEDRHGEDSAAELRNLCASVRSVPVPGRPRLAEAKKLIQGKPRVLGRFETPALRRGVAALQAKVLPHVALASTVHVAPSVSPLRGVARVVDLMDVYSDVWLEIAEWRRPPRSWFDRLEGRRLARLEEEITRRFDRVVVVSKEEARRLRATSPSAPVSVIGNGVDLDYFTPVRSFEDGADRVVPASILFMGTMDYPPNHDAARHLVLDILPILPQGTGVLVVGRNPLRELRALSSRPFVTVTGEVQDVREFLSAASVAVFPMRMGRGVQNKVLEAMASGLPVVTTPLGAEGIEGASADGLFTASTAREIAAAATRLLTDPSLSRSLGARARAWVERHHRWDDRGRELLAVLEKACGARGPDGSGDRTP